jgi:hypothetical protein
MWMEGLGSTSTPQWGPSSSALREGDSICIAIPVGYTSTIPQADSVPLLCPPPLTLPTVIACPSISAPRVVSLAQRPGPPLPLTMANGKPLPNRAFNPFEDAAPPGTFDYVCKQIAECAHASGGTGAVMRIDYETIGATSKKALTIDQQMRDGGFCGFLIHNKRDVLVTGLNADLCAATFAGGASERGASFVVTEASAMAPLIAASGKRAAASFTIYDDFTTRFGYSVGQLSALVTKPSGEFLSRAIARGGPASIHFRNNVESTTLGQSRADFRQELVESAMESSGDFRKWVAKGRPRVTPQFRANCEWVRAPFTLTDSLPLSSNADQIRLASWETALRGVEEHLMRSIFGSLPNITWARILATVFEKAEAQMGDFDVDNYRRWAAADWNNAHGVGPGKLGCPWKGCASRELPKGANGVKPSKPMHDDDNGVISLGCWTSMTEADVPTDLVFLINGVEVIIGATPLRWVLFMGMIPHESRPRDPSQSATTPRVHHSSFQKPEGEHLAAHILSNLPCKRGGGDWSMDQVHRLRAEAFEDASMRPILSRGAEERRDEVSLS